MDLQRPISYGDLEAVAELSRALAHAGDVDEIARVLVERVLDAEPVDLALLELIDESRHEARGVFGVVDGEPAAWVRDVRIDLDREPSGTAAAVAARAPLVFDDAEGSPVVSRRLVDQTGAKSVVFVPVFAGDRVIGVVVAASIRDRYSFDRSETALIEALAAQAGLALERTRSGAALAAALERERLLARVARAVRSELDLEAVLATATREIAGALRVERCFVRLGDPDGPMPIVGEWCAPGIETIGSAPERRLVSNLAARERRTIAVADIEDAPELDDPTLGDPAALVEIGTRAALATPIVVFDRLIGVFSLHQSQPRPWSEPETALAEAVAREVGLAVHTARLLAKNAERLARQDALLNAAQAVTSELHLEAVLERLVAELAAVLQADAADCCLLDAGRGALRVAAVHGLDPVVLGWEFSGDRGLAGQALRTRRAVLSNEYESIRFEVAHPAYEGFHAAIVAPMVGVRGELVGVVGVGSRDESRVYDRGDADAAEIFASLAALALRNAESFERSDRQARIQRGFYRIAAALNEPLSQRETLDAIAQAASEALGASSAAVLMTEADGTRLRASYELAEPLAAALAAGLPDGADVLASAAEDGRVLAASALVDDGRFGDDWRSLAAEAGYAALLAAPLLAPRPEARGLVLALFPTPRMFTDDDVELARHLTAAARGALERSDLYEAERSAHAIARQLARTGGRLAAGLDPRAVVDEVVQRAPELLSADAAVLWRLEGDALVADATAGGGADLPSGLAVPPTARPAADVVHSGAPVMVAAADATHRSDPLLRGGFEASVSVPLIGAGGGLYGVLTAYARTPRSWRPEEVQALEALAANASAALSNAELYQRVALEKERSDAILASIADGIVAVDREGRVVLWNAAAERITGVPASEAVGRSPDDVVGRSLSGGEEGRPGRRLVAISRGGEEAWLSVTEAVMRDPVGGVAGRVFAFRDVSAERVVEQLKSDFVVSVSHELRAPLTSIYGFAETLLRREGQFAEEERQTFLRYIAAESERLTGIVERLLSIARLESGDLEVNFDEVDVGTLLADAVRRAETLERGDGHRFVLDLPEEVLAAKADRDKLRQVLADLLDNAVRYTPNGSSITVTARGVEDAVEVLVADQGAGIPPAEQPLIFRKFYRGSDPASAGAGAGPGAGLGLFIARGLVRAMGGDMWVASTEGRGSSFGFQLQAAKGSE